MVAHGGTSVAGSFIQTLTMVDVAAGWTECQPLVNRDGSLSLRRSSAPRACSPGEACCRPPAKRKAQMMDDAFQPCCSARPQWDNLVTEPLGENPPTAMRDLTQVPPRVYLEAYWPARTWQVCDLSDVSVMDSARGHSAQWAYGHQCF